VTYSLSRAVSLNQAKKTVVSLYDYLHIKGLYLFAKILPEDNTLGKQENVEFIIDFLDKTTLKNHPFWFKLERCDFTLMKLYTICLCWVIFVVMIYNRCSHCVGR
jgi:hypothetical protein